MAILKTSVTRSGKSYKWRQQSHHKIVHKYEKQALRTSENKRLSRQRYIVSNPNDAQNKVALIGLGFGKWATPDIPIPLQKGKSLKGICFCWNRAHEEDGIVIHIIHTCGITNWGLNQKQARLAYLEIVMCRKCQKLAGRNTLCSEHHTIYVK